MLLVAVQAALRKERAWEGTTTSVYKEMERLKSELNGYKIREAQIFGEM